MRALIVAALLFSGCSSNRISLAEKNLVSVKKQDSKKIEILWADVYEKDGQTWVYGVLKQQRPSPIAIKTHVDIQVLATGESAYYETVSEDVYVPRNRAGKGIGWKKFKVRLPDTIAEGSQITMTVHSGSHEQRKDMSLQDNSDIH